MWFRVKGTHGPLQCVCHHSRRTNRPCGPCTALQRDTVTWGTGFRARGSGFGIQGPGCRVQDSGFKVQGSGFRVQDPGSRVQDSRFRV
jgi:hypothetical protein